MRSFLCHPYDTRVHDDTAMDYIIGAGAILESGHAASITPATLHAHVDSALASRVGVAAIDFDSASAHALNRLLVLVKGWNAARFRSDVSEKLRSMGECTVADVLSVLARAAGAREVHLFAHWLPDEGTCAALQAQDIAIVAHPLESIEAASLIAAQRREHWKAA